MTESAAELMADEAARKLLRSIPGVVGIGYGLKEVKGQITPVMVYRVYVEKKKLPKELLPHEQIPAEINGHLTDVIERPENNLQPLCCNGIPRAGDQIARFLTNTDIIEDPDTVGTLGCFVTRGGNNYLLSNEHVIKGMISYASDEIYHGTKSRPCGTRCNEPIAHMTTNSIDPSEPLFSWKDLRISPYNSPTYTRLGDHAAQVDCAIGLMRSGVAFTNLTTEYGAVSTTIRDLTGGKFQTPVAVTSPPVVPKTYPVPGGETIEVQKKGRTTGHTRGTIIEVAHDEFFPQLDPSSTLSEWFICWELFVTPNEHGSDVDYEVTVHDDDLAKIDVLVNEMKNTPVKAQKINSNTIRFHGKTFSEKGDSGSLVVDMNRKPVGLLWGGKAASSIHLAIPYNNEEYHRPSTGVAAVTPIAAVFYKLGLVPGSAIVPVTTPSSGAVMAGEEISREELYGTRITLRLDRIKEALRNNVFSEKWYPQGESFIEEIRRLVNFCRPVKVCWHRHHGPAFVAAYIDALKSEDGIFPATVKNISLPDLLAAMRRAVYPFAGNSLKQFLNEAGDEIIHFASTVGSVNDLIQCISEKQEKVNA
ncbi:MAG: hypothetical protein MUC87_09025 [Bacteroidia bacterium]|jgi:hypothetical protein|nr:hypothetical protein [Bacteroidia bacterium]